jgi:hypothetical protein
MMKTLMSRRSVWIRSIEVQDATTYLTQIQHRETPMRIMQGKSDAGVTWASEVRFQEKIGNPIKGVPIPADQNTTAIYAAGVLHTARRRRHGLPI